MALSIQETPEGVMVAVRVAPRSSRSGMDGAVGDALRVRVTAAPVDGKANKAVAEVLADACGIAKSAIVFKSGETSKTKRILLRGLSRADVEAVLRKQEKST